MRRTEQGAGTSRAVTASLGLGLLPTRATKEIRRILRSTLDEQLEAQIRWEEVQGVLSQPFYIGGPTKGA